MIYDIVSYFNEIELLKLRLKSLRGLVDCFIIVESDTTHTGIPKDFSLSEHISKLSIDYNIKYVQHIGEKFPHSPWVNENSQRNYALNNLCFDPEDIIMISDVDEIPSQSFIQTIEKSNYNGVFISIQELSFFWPNLRSSKQPMWMGGTRAIRWKNTNTIGLMNFAYGSTFLKELNNGFTLTKLRLINTGRPILGGGWHLSYYGGLERVATKLSAFAHSELNEVKSSEERIACFLKDGKGFFADEKYSVFGSYIEDSSLEVPPVSFRRGGVFVRLVSVGHSLFYYMKIILKTYGRL